MIDISHLLFKCSNSIFFSKSLECCCSSHKVLSKSKIIFLLTFMVADPTVIRYPLICLPHRPIINFATTWYFPTSANLLITRAYILIWWWKVSFNSIEKETCVFFSTYRNRVYYNFSWFYRNKILICRSLNSRQWFYVHLLQ